MPPEADFRRNLIVDKDSAVLIRKAWRDYDRRGWAHLAIPHGEDALTWNMFRSLDLRGPREVFLRFFGLTSPVKDVFRWWYRVRTTAR